MTANTVPSEEERHEIERVLELEQKHKDLDCYGTWRMPDEEENEHEECS